MVGREFPQNVLVKIFVYTIQTQVLYLGSYCTHLKQAPVQKLLHPPKGGTRVLPPFPNLASFDVVIGMFKLL